jgi:arylformamidase
MTAQAGRQLEEAMFGGRYRIIDISQPVTSRSACFPGDVPFSKQMTLKYADCQVINLTAMTLSPHVGTHADAPSHIGGDMNVAQDMAGALPLEPYAGACLVIDAAPWKEALTADLLEAKIQRLDVVPPRILFKTQLVINYDVFEEEYAHFSVELVKKAHEYGIELLGLDTPSVDHVKSKNLEAHHALMDAGLCWLENLDLTQVTAGVYFMVAFPLKFMELEATPVRAVLFGAANV